MCTFICVWHKNGHAHWKNIFLSPSEFLFYCFYLAGIKSFGFHIYASSHIVKSQVPL